MTWLSLRQTLIISLFFVLASGAVAAAWEFIFAPVFGGIEAFSERMRFVAHGAFIPLIPALGLLLFIGYRQGRYRDTLALERKKLKEAESRFLDFAEAGSDWFWEMDKDLRYSYYSKRYTEVTGIPVKDIIGKTRAEFPIPDLDDQVWKDHLKTFEDHKPFRDFVHFRVRKDGKTVWLNINGVPVYDSDGHFQGYRGSGRDITARKEIEENLRASEQRFRDISEAASDWFWETCPDLRFVYISERFFELTGIKPEDIIGKTRWEFASAETIALAPESWRQHQKGLEAHEPFRDFRYETINKNGERNYISLSGKPIYDEDGMFIGYRGTGTDVTELQTTRNKHILAKEEAEKANQAKSEFLASMSHELRTPMNAIIGFGELVLHNTNDPISNKNIEYMGHILSSASHLMELINQILELSRIESGMVIMEPEAISFESALEETVMLILGQAHKRNITINTDCSCSENTDIWADPLRLKQILFNLITNAIKYNRPGGTVDINCGIKDNTHVQIWIKDTGLGIPEHAHDEVFQPFNRLGLEAKNIEGTGIGLSITKDLVERMNGAIGFESSLGVGSTFWVTLPRRPSGDIDESRQSA